MNDQHGGTRQQPDRQQLDRQQFSGQRDKSYPESEVNQRDDRDSRRNEQYSDRGLQSRSGRGDDQWNDRGGYGNASGSESYQGQSYSARKPQFEGQNYGSGSNRGSSQGDYGSSFEQDGSNRSYGSQYGSTSSAGGGYASGEYTPSRNRAGGGGGYGQGDDRQRDYRAAQPSGQAGYGSNSAQYGSRPDRGASQFPGGYGHEGSTGGYPDSGYAYGAGDDRAGWSGQQSTYGGGRRAQFGSGSTGYGSADGSSGGSATMRPGSGQSGSMNAYESMFASGASRQRGAAPRSYKRSDERVNEDVCERLVEAGIDCSGVDVEVKDGVVTLNGEVQQRADKHRIEQIAADSSGVQDVENQLRVKKSSGSDQSGKSSQDTGSYSTNSSNANRSTMSSNQSTSAATGISGAVAKAGDTTTAKKY